nr:hypothetical protein [Bacilli bacterium]
MVRENGYVNWDDTLKKLGIDTTSLDTVMGSDKVTVIKGSRSNVFSFKHDGNNLFFKTNLIGGEEFYYAELLAEELAKDYGIPCASYDLAKICGHTGVISKDIRKENATYINLKDIIKMYHGEVINNFDLLTISKDLNNYYKNRENREEILATLYSQIIDIFIFDVLVAQFDPFNLMIMEDNGKVSMAPIFDNEYMQWKDRKTGFHFGVDEKLDSKDKDRALIAFDRFLSISNDVFIKKVVDKMWIIGENNLEAKFGVIERKTGSIIEKQFVPTPVPPDIKNRFMTMFNDYRKKLIEVLNKHIEVPIVENGRIKK